MSGRRATAYAKALVRRGSTSRRWRAPISRSPFVRFPSEVGRALIPGPPRAVAGIGRDELVSAVRRGIRDPRQVTLMVASSLFRAGAVAPMPVPFFLDGVGVLFDHVLRSAPTPQEGLVKLLAGDMLGKRTVSLDERGMRVGKALMSATAELLSRERDPAVLFEPRMLDMTAAFVRGYVSRNGYEHGSRFELRQIVEMDAVFSGWLGMRHQLQVPDLLGALASGPDTILYSGDTAFRVEYKAFKDLDSLIAGDLSVQRVDVTVSGTTQTESFITGVEGPAIPKQEYTGALRLLHWQNRVPGLGMEPPHNGGLPPDPAELRLWPHVSPVAVFVVDDEHLVNKALVVISDAVHRTRKTSINLRTDTRTSNAVRDFLVDMFGGEVVEVAGRSAWEDLQDDARAWLIAQIPRLQSDVNRFLAHPKSQADLKQINQVRLVLASDGIERIPAVLGLRRP